MRRKQGLRADNAGFSFIDVMMALVILTIGVLALANLQVVASKGNTSSQTLTTASNIAEKKLEEVRGMVYASIVAEAPTPVPDSGVTFTRQVTVATNSPITNTKTVTVIVTWSDQTGSHTVSLATILAL